LTDVKYFERKVDKVAAFVFYRLLVKEQVQRTYFEQDVYSKRDRFFAVVRMFN
jgi:hypothetical protein